MHSKMTVQTNASSLLGQVVIKRRISLVKAREGSLTSLRKVISDGQIRYARVGNDYLKLERLLVHGSKSLPHHALL